MKCKKYIFSLLVFAFLVLSFTSKAQYLVSDVCGYWNTVNNESIVKIFKDAEGKIWGEISKLREAIDTVKSSPNYGKPWIDIHTKKPIVGTQLFLGLIFDGDDCWEDGKVYDPETGKKYDCCLELSKDKNTLMVTGYIGAKFLGKTIEWTRNKNL